jgi:hypothetical protein
LPYKGLAKFFLVGKMLRLLSQFSLNYGCPSQTHPYSAPKILV